VKRRLLKKYDLVTRNGKNNMNTIAIIKVRKSVDIS